LHDIIVSSKVANGSKPAGYPWMVDGAGVPTNAAQLLTDLVNALVTSLISFEF
jgi:inositol hexakisphosphate/diphosphoinositol-pentakisphosphate kinase